ncbi:hypothetical protein ACFLW9_00060 [Chloroflexota bacterium]
MNKLVHSIFGSKIKGFLVTALMLSLVVTGGLFAYAYTIDTTSLTVGSGGADFAAIADNNTYASPAWTVFGSYRGNIPSGTLFNVTPTANYTGDFEVNVYLSNLDNMSKTYGMFLMRMVLVDSGDSEVDVEGIEKPLTLQNGVVSFVAENLTGGQTYFIKSTGGVFRAFPWAYLTGKTIYGPTFHAEVTQAGL